MRLVQSWVSIQRAVIKGVYVVGGSRWANRLARWWGWSRFINDRVVHDHSAWCTSADVHAEPRVGGMVRICRTCGTLVEIQFSFWEVDGMVPPEVTQWIFRDIQLHLLNTEKPD